MDLWRKVMLLFPKRSTVIIGITCIFLLIISIFSLAQRDESLTSYPSREGAVTIPISPSKEGGVTIPFIKFDPTDGTDDYLDRGGRLTEIKNGKTGSISFWYRPVATKADQ
jgi:hypothetical protein